MVPVTTLTEPHSVNFVPFVDDIFYDKEVDLIIRKGVALDKCSVCAVSTLFAVIYTNPNYNQSYTNKDGLTKHNYNTKYNFAPICSTSCYEMHKANLVLKAAAAPEEDEDILYFRTNLLDRLIINKIQRALTSKPNRGTIHP